MRKYAHLLKPDAAVWERWLAEHENEYLYFEYDVRVGLGRDPGEIEPEGVRKMALDLSMRRIDAVGFKRGVIEVIEVTKEAGFTALGQVMGYPVLYRMTYFPARVVVGRVVCESFQSDLKVVYDSLRVKYDLV